MTRVKPRGPVDAKYVIVGDCPKQEEVDNGLAFDTQVFNLLVDLLEECEIDYNDVLFVNATQFSKRSGKVTAEELKADAKEHLIPLLNSYPRELVMVMGNNALCASGVTKKPEKINSLKGQVVQSEDLTTTQTLVPIIHPYQVLKEPDLVDEFIQTANFAFRVSKDPTKLTDQVPIVIYDIETIEDIDYLIECATESQVVAYDFETTGTGRSDYPISCAFATGHQNENGEYLVFFWASHNKMVPMYTDDQYAEFIKKFEVFFKLSGINYARVAWNKSFDDPMAERLIGCELPPSDFDAMIEKWSVNSRRPHDLKTNTAKYLGYANYDKAVDDAVKEVAARRGNLLTNEEDFFVLKLFGHEPEKSAKGYKWTKDVDKKLCAWAMIDFETLRLYNCLSGDTKVITSKGVFPIADIAGKSVEILDGNGEWTLSHVKQFGVDTTRTLKFMYTSGGKVVHEIKATANHRWITLDGKEVTSSNLTVGEVIPMNLPKRNTRIDSEDYLSGLRHGLVYGDGTTIKSTSGATKGNTLGFQIRLCGKDAELLNVFTSAAGVKVYYPPSAKGDPVVQLRGHMYRGLKWKELPIAENVSADYLIGFFRGWLSADGCVDTKSHVSICVSQFESEWLRSVMPVVGYEFGAWSAHSKSGYPGSKKRVGNLTVVRFSLTKDDILLEHKRNRFTEQKAHFVYKGYSITETDFEQPVYCATVPTTNSFTLAGGILTGNCYDAIYTLLLHLKFKKVIEKEKLANSCEFRHRVSYRLVGAEQRGLQLDVKANRSFSKELGKISANCQKQIISELALMGFDLPDFNAASGDQLAEILYGKPTTIPSIDVDGIIDQTGWDELVAQDRCGAFMDDFYENGTWIKPLINDKLFDYDDIARRLSNEFTKKFNFTPVLIPTMVYLFGRHEPSAFTKTGKPSTAGAILTSIYNQNKEPFLSMVLLKRKVDKLKSTFIDAIYKSRDENNIVRCRYNVIGTDTGRISSCVRRGTLVETSIGKRPIEDLRIGDLVYGDDLQLHKCTVDAFTKPLTQFYRVTLEDGSTIECTAAHRFKTADGWKKLSELCESDEVLWYDTNQDVPTTLN